MVPIALDTVYSITVSGKEEYTMINQGNSIDVIEYIREYVNTEDTTTNTITNETDNTQSNNIE